MSKAILDWATQNATLAVALAILLVALVIAILGLILTMWLKPRLTEFEILRKDVSELKATASRGASAADTLPAVQREIAVAAAGLNELRSQKLSEAISAGNVRLVSLEAAKAAEDALQQQKLLTLERSVAQALSAMESLQSRSEEEIARIQKESEKTIDTIKKDSREELIRQNNLERVRLALEQAEQDLQLAQIRVQLARGYEPFHTEALTRAQSAQARVEALKVQGQSGSAAAGA